MSLGIPSDKLPLITRYKPILPIRTPFNYESVNQEEEEEEEDEGDRGGFPQRVENDNPNEGSVFSLRKLWLFTGPGILMSVAFLDPGNLESDIQAGAFAGYSLLWLLMWSTAMGLVFQLLSARLGVATGEHLAEICRKEYPFWASFVMWITAEVAIIGADIQEVMGSAIAIRLLTNGAFPLWVGVLVTSLDCILCLLLEKYGVRKLEALFAGIIGVMTVSFAWMFQQAKPDGRELLLGLVIPRLSRNTTKQAVGIVGCITTPHNIFLHSALVRSRRINRNCKIHLREALLYYTIESSLALALAFAINVSVTTVFARGFHTSLKPPDIGLANAAHLLQDKYGSMVGSIWAIGLLAAGQSSTITGTYAGQLVMDGFLDLKMKRWVRAIITRSFAIVPTMIAAIAFEPYMDSVNEWMNVVQAMQIPFVLVPLLRLVSQKQLMGVLTVCATMKIISWVMAIVIVLINGYMLFGFFANEQLSMWLGVPLSIMASLYLFFLIYLVIRRVCTPTV